LAELGRGIDKLSTEKRAQAVAALVDGSSVRATIRRTGVAKNTIQKLQLELDAACSAYLDRPLRNLKFKRVQIDEILVVCRGEASGCRSGKRPAHPGGSVIRRRFCFCTCRLKDDP
jgi:transposase